MAEPTKKQSFIFINNFNECKGKDSAVAEYSMVGAQETDAQCNQNSSVTTAIVMIPNKPNGKRTVINLVQLSMARFPAGGESLV